MANRQRTHEEAEELVAKFTRASAELSAEESAREHAEQRIEKFFKWAYAFGIMVAGVVGWQTKIQVDVTRHETEIVKLTTKQEASHETISTLRNTVDGNKAERDREIRAIRDDIAPLKKDAEKVSEMWFMKEHGISNKEAYQQHHGVPAPKLAE